MEFEFQDNIYVEECDLGEMCNMAKNGVSIADAVDNVSAGWDDVDYYRVGYIKDQLIKEIKRRLVQKKSKQKIDKK